MRSFSPLEIVRTGDGRSGNDLAVVLDLREEAGADDLATSSRFGRWRFSWDGSNAGSRAGVAALEAGRRACEVQLIGPAGVLDAARIKAIPHSLRRTQERLEAAAATMPAKTLKLMLAGCTPHAPLERTDGPSKRQGVSRLAQARNLLGRVLRESWEEEWRVGILDQTADELVAGLDHARLTWLPARPGGYHADPFGCIDDQQLIFAEAYDFKERLGYIVSIGQDGTERTVLREPFHLSYPQIVSHGGRKWMLPEAKAAGCVRLYAADPWPTRFVPGPILIEGLAAADPTLFQNEHGYWLFAGDGNAQDETTLVLYHAQNLLGPWRPHPMNPIKVDLGSARPAGPLIRSGGRLWRPGQDCSATYGGAIVLNEVVLLTPDLYAERPGTRLEPDPSGPCPDGLHTLTPFGNKFLVDGKREFRSLARWVVGLKSLARG